MIAIIDYGAGNLRSVQKAFELLGYEAVVTKDTEIIASANSLVLPGVGAFKEGMRMLTDGGLVDTIIEQIHKKVPFLGICLGMQMLFDSSDEEGHAQGLGILKGDIKKFDIDLKIPHMGWNEVVPTIESPLYKGIEDKYFYFVHSYCLSADNENINATCSYGVDFGCSVEKDNVFGVQFHPEKSGESGLKLLDNFAKLRG